MVMSTKLPSPDYLTNAKLASSEHSRARFPPSGLVVCIHKTAFAFGKRLYSRLCFVRIANISLLNKSKRLAWSVRSSADGGGLDDTSPTNNTRSGTRLIRAVEDIRIKLSSRIKEIRKNLPMKFFFFLVGFYCATALVTVIGQTGDWDILGAALSVAVVEGIGSLMYRASLPLFTKVQSLITMFNYWKAGLSLGLFLDAFKYEMENIFGLSNPLDFDRYLPYILLTFCGE
ncbi:Ycf20-like protein [Camellia lanceoleosa]|uniref:Ycf20-like protein n=1 Tax=Camellia lanceoleosa TaxID=1840588 RepID=A0ACC0I9G9_9ERIC|nr:Ycf20-like protein [Camellia lanceoleosa]